MGSTGRGIVTSTDVYNQTARLDAQLREGLITSEQRDAAMAALNTSREVGDRITQIADYSTKGKISKTADGQWSGYNDNGSGVEILDAGKEDINFYRYGSRQIYEVHRYNPGVNQANEAETLYVPTKKEAMDRAKEWLRRNK